MSMFNANSMAVFLVAFIVLVLFSQATRDFTSSEQHKLLRFVNIFRKVVANCNCSPAANMQEIIWDDKLVEMAQSDVANCKVVASHGAEISGVAIFLQNYSRIEDFIAYVRNDPVTRPYLVKATFYSMGCAMNDTSCPEGHEVICYWYPLCGTLYNAYEEGPMACDEFGSNKSRTYKGLCMMPRDERTEIGYERDHEVCAHKRRKKLSAEELEAAKEKQDANEEKVTVAKFMRFF